MGVHKAGFSKGLDMPARSHGNQFGTEPGAGRALRYSPCTPKALSPGVERHILGVKIMHTASDSTRRSRYTTLWFRTSANILLFAHRARGDLCGANATPSVCMGFYGSDSVSLTTTVI